MPIDLDLLPAPNQALPAGTLARLGAGRIGMMSFPGRYSGRAALDLDEVAALPATTLVSLLPAGDRAACGLGGLPGLAARARLDLLELAIDDFQPPGDIDACADLVSEILARVSRGETVVIHCVGGHGRTGTIAACCLVATGMGARAAIDAVRAARTGTVETDGQVDFVGDFERYLAARP